MSFLEPKMASSNQIKFIRVTELATMLSISKATCWRWVKLGRLPQPRKLGPGVTVWPLAEVEARVQALGDAK